METQNKQIRQYLESGHKLTPLDAFINLIASDLEQEFTISKIRE